MTESNVSQNILKLESCQASPSSGREVLASFGPIQINLGAPDENRTLALSVEAAVDDVCAKELEQSRGQVRDAIIMIASGQTCEFLNSREGRRFLKGAIAGRIARILRTEKPIDVFITDMLIK